MKPVKLLVVEDDPALNEQLALLLTNKGYEVDRSYDGDEGLTSALTQSYHLIILDVMMPKRDGYAVLKNIRKTRSTPVLMLTAKGAEEERINGFHHGADDYLTKPFNSTELLLRIEALLRRSGGDPEVAHVAELHFHDISLNKAQRRATVCGENLDLTPIQFRLLWTLMLYRGDVLSKAFLYQTVLHRTLGPHDRSLDMHLSRVRRKIISAGGRGEALQTVHGEGYCLS
ncbi:response regulator transcription factor PirR [Arenicella sp. 4NH20-0111]|uniref:response regulator transcription factor n=1 Tax=Arenicella sp. 4NH20-0111 TaxID=3127648 RepID=UPI0031087DA3